MRRSSSNAIVGPCSFAVGEVAEALSGQRGRVRQPVDCPRLAYNLAGDRDIPRHDLDDPGPRVAKQTADVDSLVGRTLGRRRYEVVARVARGGMATVYRAHDRQLDRVVAVKVPRPEFARDPGFSEQFRREARAAARLSHPNVVAVYDSGEERGLPWIVMEYVSGQTLRDLLDRQGRLDLETTAEIVGEVADALDHAHHAGIAHLDMKPENVLLTSESVKVADFGLVRAAHAGSDTPLAGTVQYLAPEVLRGGLVDGRADVYALGVLAYECLTGRPPFTGPSQDDVIRQHLAGRVPPPSLQVQGVPQPVDAAIWQATDPDPARRFARASEFAAALGAPRRRRVDEALRAATVVPPARELDAVTRSVAAAPPHGPAPLDGGAAAPGQRPAGGAARLAPAPPPTLHPRPTTGRVPRPRPPRERGGRWRGRLAVTLVTLGVLAALVGGALAFVTSRTVEMPDVVGQTVGVARVRLQALGLRVSVGAPIPSPNVPKGRVASQSVFPARSVHRLSKVQLRPSAGIVLPDLRNQGAETAKATLERLRLGYAVATRASTAVPAGQVVASDPAPGTLLDGQQVQLTVSSGPPRVSVPDVRGATYAEARAALVGAGLRVRRAFVFSGDVPPGRVVSTDPPGGATPLRGSVVEVRSSRGPDVVAVPDVRSLPRDQAVGLLQQLGFQVDVAFPGFGDHVTDQSLPPGARVNRGSRITLSLSIF
jgi:eukaryotic-like serine/threonine-protein kinase